MDVYIYQADIWCEDCGEQIRSDIIEKGQAPENPDDEGEYDSDEFPKGPYPDGGGESDSFQHCAAQQGCLNAMDIGGGHKVGVFLGNDLTSEGTHYTCELLQEYLAGHGGTEAVLDLWANELRDYPLGSDDRGILADYLDRRAEEQAGRPTARGRYHRIASMF